MSYHDDYPLSFYILPNISCFCHLCQFALIVVYYHSVIQIKDNPGQSQMGDFFVVFLRFLQLFS